MVVVVDGGPSVYIYCDERVSAHLSVKRAAQSVRKVARAPALGVYYNPCARPFFSLEIAFFSSLMRYTSAI